MSADARTTSALAGSPRPTIAAHGLVVEVNDGWEARVFRRTATEAGDETLPVVHLATFPLPAERGDFGAGAVEVMDRDDIFVTVFEFGPESAGQPLFASEGWPTIEPQHFETARLQHAIPGQSGVQYFFHVGGRAFCVYAVLGSHARRAELAPKVAAAVAAVSVEVSE
jgi:hypothetical protein